MKRGKGGNDGGGAEKGNPLAAATVCAALYWAHYLIPPAALGRRRFKCSWTEQTIIAQPATAQGCAAFSLCVCVRGARLWEKVLQQCGITASGWLYGLWLGSIISWAELAAATSRRRSLAPLCSCKQRGPGIFMVCISAWNSADKFTPSALLARAAARISWFWRSALLARLLVTTEPGGPSVSDTIPAPCIGRGHACPNIQWGWISRKQFAEFLIPCKLHGSAIQWRINIFFLSPFGNKNKKDQVNICTHHLTLVLGFY